ncbi:MAG: hypothetical protein K9J13_16200 [Saprospiraceae bacterium]|nr:hypothetical protein [Saprospiraceae bacterium]
MAKMVEKPKYPSPCGSHASMVNDTYTQILDQSGMVVCVDDEGPYVTEASKLDKGLCDVNRYNTPSARKQGKQIKKQAEDQTEPALGE